MASFSPLLAAEDLRRRMGGGDLVVLDATVGRSVDGSGRRKWISGRAEFKERHLPGARYADLLGDFSEPEAPFAFTRASPARFAAAAARLGVGADTEVAIYDREEGIWAARLWWQFRALGFLRARVLDGGLTGWANHGGLIEAGDPDPPPPTPPFVPQENNALWADRDDVRAIMEGKRAGTLVCALRRPVFAGAEAPYGRAGHIPSSVNWPYRDLLGAGGEYLERDALRDALGPLLSAEGPIVSYCGGGVSACSLALGLTLAGRDDVAVYDGSLSEWAADPELPMISLSEP
jgi:thiosulfate/3-mercaptopyruvate sulfurtransferase